MLCLFGEFCIFISINEGSHGSKNPEVMEMLGFGLSISKSKSYKFTLKQNNSTELSGYSFNNITIRMVKLAKHVKCVGFSKIS